MPAYLVFDIEVTDQAAYEEYKRVAGPVLARGGGRFVFSSSKVEALEGGWSPASLSVVEFDSVEAARTFYHSPEYQAVAAMRQRASCGRGVLVEV